MVARRKFLAAVFAISLLIPLPAAALSGSARRRLLRQIIRAIAGIFTQGFPQAWEQLMRALADELEHQNQQRTDKELKAISMAGDAIVGSVVDTHNHTIWLAANDMPSSCRHVANGVTGRLAPTPATTGRSSGVNLAGRMHLARDRAIDPVALASSLTEALASDNVTEKQIADARTMLRLQMPLDGNANTGSADRHDITSLAMSELVARYAAIETAVEQMLARRMAAPPQKSLVATLRDTAAEMSSSEWHAALRDQPSQTVLMRELCRIRAYKQAISLELSRTNESIALIQSISQGVQLKPLRSRT